VDDAPPGAVSAHSSFDAILATGVGTAQALGRRLRLSRFPRGSGPGFPAPARSPSRGTGGGDRQPKGDPSATSLQPCPGPGGRARWRHQPRLNGRCFGFDRLGPSLDCPDGCGVVASRRCLLCHARPAGTRHTLPRAAGAPTPPVQAAATTRLRSGFPSGAAHGLCLLRLPRSQRASYQPSSRGQARSTKR
jgi:hypothetical protein